MLPYVTETEQSRILTATFLGLNETMEPGDGEWQRTRNLTGDSYPLLSPRGNRTLSGSAAVENLGGLLYKEALYTVRGTTLYVNGSATAMTNLTQPTVYRAETQPAGITAGQYWVQPSTGVCHLYANGTSREVPYPQKQLVSMGAYLLIFPDGAYYNTEDGTDYGYIDASFQTVDQAVNYAICKSDGTAYAQPTAQNEAPENPTSGQLWINTSQETHALYEWSSTSQQWVSIPTVYVRITFSTVGTMTGLKAGDGVTLSGISGAADIEALNGSQILQGVGGGGQVNDYIVVTGLLDASRLQTTGTVRVERAHPEMDFVVEAGNRLWGCKYGRVDGKNVNELYCSKLGDFKNWTVYAGISTDAWAASVGSDGPFTGAVNYLGYPTFFKKNRMHRIAIASDGAHQAVEMECRGVKQGCDRSLSIVDEVLYYVSDSGICAYDGSLPDSVSRKLTGTFRFASGCTDGKKYRLAALREKGWETMVYDTEKGFWLTEDNTVCVGMASGDGCPAVVVNGEGKTDLVYLVNRGENTAEGDITWLAESGIMGYEYTDHKYLSRFDIRMKLPQGAYLHLEMEYDSSGRWVDCGTIHGKGVNSFILPVRPRRCDHLRYRLSGRGDVRIYSVSRILEVGSDV